ncbi:MAG: hypothetical protein ACXWTS_04265 [Methylococcaceae bacterium]
MAITRYEREDLLDKLTSSQQNKTHKESIAATEWASTIGMQEEADKFTVQNDIPHDKTESEVSMEAGILTLTGGKKWLLPVMNLGAY